MAVVTCTSERCEKVIELYSDVSLKPGDERHFSPDLQFIDIPAGITVHGIDEFRDYLDAYSRAFPDLSAEIERIVDGGEWLAVEYVLKGTNTGPFLGPEGEVAPTGKRIEHWNLDLIHFDEDGKVDCVRDYYDAASLYSQLGLSG